jgi:hypothetical protein
MTAHEQKNINAVYSVSEFSKFEVSCCLSVEGCCQLQDSVIIIPIHMLEKY